MSYQLLATHFSRIGQLGEVAAIVEWDQAVNMPAAAGPARAHAMAGLSTITHELLTATQVEEWLHTAEQDAALSEEERANLSLMRHRYRRATALPQDLVYELTEASKISEQAWRRYRAENDFRSYAPFLERVLKAARAASSALGDALGLSPYEAMVDEYEPGLRLATIESAFAPLRAELPGLRQEILAARSKLNVTPPVGPFAESAQKELGLIIMEATGVDMSRVRLDVSHHPFCGGVPTDVRITTRYETSEFLSALLGVIHESGHARYEQGLPTRWAHQPLGQARGMVTHESQSLFFEMQVCRGEDFLHFLRPHLLTVFPEQAKHMPSAFSEENLSRLVTRVAPGLIRVNADEVTYPAHILLRYELEQALIAGQLAVQDLPEAWDQKMQEYLGLRTLGDDRNGCMQDVHWPSGAFGYFPLYTLGAMVSAQLFAAASAKLPELARQIQEGEFSALNAFLAENIWRHGSRYDVDQLLQRATGEGLKPEHFLAHLRRRYLTPS